MNWPNEPTGNSPLAQFLRKLVRCCKAGELKSGANYLVKETGSGKVLEMRPGGVGGGFELKEYHLKSVADNHLVCRAWDGTNEGATDVYIAKDPKLRCSITNEVIYGVTHNYTYAAGPDSDNAQRTDDFSSPAEDQLVTPPWIAVSGSTGGDIIYALAAKTELTDPGGKPINLIEVLPRRQWAKKPAS